MDIRKTACTWRLWSFSHSIRAWFSPAYCQTHVMQNSKKISGHPVAKATITFLGWTRRFQPSSVDEWRLGSSRQETRESSSQAKPGSPSLSTRRSIRWRMCNYKAGKLLNKSKHWGLRRLGNDHRNPTYTSGLGITKPPTWMTCWARKFGFPWGSVSEKIQSEQR